MLVDVIAQQIFKASLPELVQLVGIRRPTLMWERERDAEAEIVTGRKETLCNTSAVGDWGETAGVARSDLHHFFLCVK